MHINFLILAHKNFTQLYRLVKVLKTERTSLYIHIDRKWNISNEEREMLSKYACIVPKRISCHLDDWSLIDATIELLNYAYSQSNLNIPSYYYLLSGQDYPIKPLPNLISLCEKEYPKPFIDCTPYDPTNWIYNKFKTPLRNKILKIPQKLIRKPLILLYSFVDPLLKPYYLSKIFAKNKINIYGGSAWWCLPDQIVEFILKKLSSDNSLLKLLKKIRTPEEIVFQILAMMSPLSHLIHINPISQVSQTCLTFANFNPPNKVFKGHPYILLSKDYPRITSMPNRFFARKFDLDIDPSILDRIDSEILNYEN